MRHMGLQSYRAESCSECKHKYFKIKVRVRQLLAWTTNVIIIRPHFNFNGRPRYTGRALSVLNFAPSASAIVDGEAPLLHNIWFQMRRILRLDISGECATSLPNCKLRQHRRQGSCEKPLAVAVIRHRSLRANTVQSQ
jgi:hypothetical protein